jgi:hypothetical protein
MTMDNRFGIRFSNRTFHGARANLYFVFFVTLPYKYHKSVRGTPFKWISIPLTETEYDVGQILPPRGTLTPKEVKSPSLMNP